MDMAPKPLYIIIGVASLVLGCVGVVMPVIPTVPFLLLTAYCFARGSEKLNDWFVSTRPYRENLQPYKEGRGMTMRTKARLLSVITVVMGVGFVVMWMKGLYIPCAILGTVWICHMVYFIGFVKTMPGEE